MLYEIIENQKDTLYPEDYKSCPMTSRIFRLFHTI